MAFVDNQVSKIAQEHRPAGVVAQQRQVNHVGVGEHPAGALTGQAAYLACAVAVVGGRSDIGQPGNGRAQRVGGPQLVVAKGFRRRDVQRTGARIGRQRSEDGQLEGQRFARRGAGADDDVMAGVRQVRGLNLMCPWRTDAPVGECAQHVGFHPCRPRLLAAMPCRQLGHVPQRVFARLGAGDRGGEQLATERHHDKEPPDSNQARESATDSPAATGRFGSASELFTSW